MINRMGHGGKMFTLRRHGVEGEAGVVRLDDRVSTTDGRWYFVKGGAAPADAHKSGYVEVAPDEGGATRTLYAHAFGLEWVHNPGTGKATEEHS